MALRGNHYDAAFEAFLRTKRTPYVAVDEQRRALLESQSLKSMDFIVYSPRQANLLVDVKGRRFPSGDPESGHRWENWPRPKTCRPCSNGRTFSETTFGRCWFSRIIS